MRSSDSRILSVAGALALGNLLLSSCGGDPPVVREERGDVPKIFDACGGRVCHGSTDPAGGLDLVSEGRDARLFGVLGSSACGEKVLVEPEYPEASLLYEKLTLDEPSCGRPMPPSGKLSDFELECIRKYIEDASGSPSCETCGGILCVDLQSDESNCGACGSPCGDGRVCAAGACIDPCEEGTTLCGDGCFDLATSGDNCGRCGHACAPGTTCQAGVCACDADLPDVTFAGDVVPIFEASCGGSDCHTGQDALSSLSLSPSAAYAALVEAPSDGCEGRVRVVPGNPDESYLIEKVVEGDVCVGKKMPMFAETLPDDVLRKLTAWICAGATSE